MGEETKSSLIKPDLKSYTERIKAECYTAVSDGGVNLDAGPLMQMVLTDKLLKLCQANSLWPMTFALPAVPSR